VQRALGGLGFGLGFSAFWFVAAVTQLPLPWYLPVEHRWAFGASVAALGMDYFGRLIGATLLGLVAAFAGRALASRAKPAWPKNAVIWLLSLLLLNALLQFAMLVTRHPVPLT